MSKISAEARKELVTAVAERYQTGVASEKGRILDEFVALTGYHRKHAICILNGNPPKLVVMPRAGHTGQRMGKPSRRSRVLSPPSPQESCNESVVLHSRPREWSLAQIPKWYFKW